MSNQTGTGLLLLMARYLERGGVSRVSSRATSSSAVVGGWFGGFADGGVWSTVGVVTGAPSSTSVFGSASWPSEGLSVFAASCEATTTEFEITIAVGGGVDGDSGGLSLLKANALQQTYFVAVIYTSSHSPVLALRRLWEKKKQAIGRELHRRRCSLVGREKMDCRQVATVAKAGRRRSVRMQMVAAQGVARTYETKRNRTK